MENNRKYKWHEHITLGILFFIVSVTLFFNGFTYLISLFVKDGNIEGGATKAKGIVAFVSLLEKGWWKHVLILIIFF